MQSLVPDIFLYSFLTANLSHAIMVFKQKVQKKCGDWGEGKGSILRNSSFATVDTFGWQKSLEQCAPAVPQSLTTFHYTHSHALQSYLTCHVHIPFSSTRLLFLWALWLCALGSALSPTHSIVLFFSLKSQEKQKKNGFRNALYLSQPFFFLEKKKR